MAKETIDISKYAVTTAHSINDLKSNISELKKALDTLPIGTKKYADALLSLQNNQAALKNAMHDTTDESNKEADSFAKTARAAQGLGTSYNALVRKMADLDQQFRATEDAGKRKDLGAQILEINNQLKKFDEDRGKFGRNVGNYESAINNLSDAFKKTAGSAGAVVNPINSATAGFKALSATPAVAILGLLANILSEVVKAMKSSEEGVEGMTAAFGVFSGIGTMVTNLLQGIAKGLGALATAFVGLLEKLGLVNDKMREQQAIAAEEIRIARMERDAIKANADAEKDIADLRAKAVDKEKFTTEERIAMLRRAGELEAKIAQRSKEAAEAAYNLQVRKNALSKSSADDLRAEAEAYAKMVQAQTNYANAVRQNTQEINAALKEQRAEAEKAEREQIRADRRKISVNKQLWEERLKHAVKGSEDEYTTRLMILEAEHLMEQKAAQADIEDADEKVQTLILIEKKFEEERLRLVEEYADNIQEAERLEMQNRMNQYEQGSWDYLGAAVELKKYELDTLHQLETESNEQFRARQLEAERAYNDAQRQLIDGRIALMQNYATAVSGIFGTIADLYEQNGEEDEKSAAAAKGLRTASAIIDTLGSAVAAYRSGIESGIPSPGNMILAATQAAAALAAGYAQVRKINAVKVGSSSGGTSAIASPAIAAPSITQVRNITGAKEEDRLNQIASENRVYLVYSDIVKANNASRVRVQETEF